MGEMANGELTKLNKQINEVNTKINQWIQCKMVAAHRLNVMFFFFLFCFSLSAAGVRRIFYGVYGETLNQVTVI